MISVIIPLYNKQEQIANTLTAILKQTHNDFEVIIVNDGSTDKSVEVINKFTDTRIRLVHQTNAGVSAARNCGIQEAKGEFIAFLDADDEWKPEYLATQISLTEEYPKCDVFATNYEFRDADGKVSQTILHKLPFNGETGILKNYFEVASCSHPPLWTSAVMVKKSAIQTVGGFPIGIKSGEDLLTWARLATQYQIAYCKKSLAVFVRDSVLFNDDQKKRVPAQRDIVGEELAKMLQTFPHIKGLRKYNHTWHKIRARIYLTKNHRKEARKEIYKAMQFHCSLKIICFGLLTILLQNITVKIFNKYK